MSDILFKNNAVSTLAAAISAVSTSLTVQSGDGLKFPSPSGSEYFRATLFDASGNLEIIKCTSRTVDILDTIVRGEEGTTPLAFAEGDRISLQFTEEGIQDKVDQELADSPVIGTPVVTGGTFEDPIITAWPDLQQAAMPTLTSASEEYLLLTPTAPGVLPLPATGIKRGRRFVILNLATDSANGIRVNASGGTQVTYCPASNYAPIKVVVMALQDTPTTAAHWKVLVSPKGALFENHTNQIVGTASDGPSMTLPADLLYRDGMALEIIVAGSDGGTGGNRAIILDGDGSVASGGVTTAPWHMRSELIRRGAAEQLAQGLHSSNGGAVVVNRNDTMTKDLTTALILKFFNSHATLTTEFDSMIVELL